MQLKVKQVKGENICKRVDVACLSSGHFLLTYLLLDLMKRSAPSRIIIVASVAHTWTELRLDDINSERSYDTMKAYGQSKLANVLFARLLAKRLQGKVLVQVVFQKFVYV